MGRALKAQDNLLEIPVIRGQVLGVKVYRGYAKLCDLSKMSKPDIYDRKSNPQGTQRDLSRKHAKAAYEYVKTRDLAFWPEVFLSVRNKKAVTYWHSSENEDIGTLKINMDISAKSKVSISRVDGNHRLHYADGADSNFTPIDKVVSFCMAYELKREEEIILFKDINDNQKAMNTSHLDNIEVRLTEEEILKRTSPDLYIAQKLGRDPKSLFYNRIYEGGRKISKIELPLRSLRSGINYMISRSNQLPPLPDADIQYKVVRNYFHAVKKWQPKAWSEPKEYIILRGAGLWAICFIGAVVVDKTLLQGKYKTDDMLKIIKSGRNWNWTNNGDFKGYSGRGGALEISKKVTMELHDQDRIPPKELYEKIMTEE
ncbi:MAG: hypothetical protein A2Y97_08265 [Nitrospirae bacterium RBG_13_39_12]|nr:MAG: hypothetical protein A2Y97_08265 [Nitrospirae bacterium RBG_13_39_12]